MDKGTNERTNKRKRKKIEEILKSKKTKTKNKKLRKGDI